ncbi:hypothetical protein [Pseudomonas syringae]|uniref:hypothetical protein n=1 Tax=Pseudomonas syringae TaxID=317 RepID=UPI0023F961C3|nr:hypothetical protein [Pseudomonas syringae]MDF5831455.1 hypothetical protein [Pseudomonas syringae]
MPISLESNLSETATNKNLIAAIEAELPAFRTMSVATEKKQKLKLTALPAPAEFLRTLIYQQYARRASPALYPPGRKTWLFAGNFVRRQARIHVDTILRCI